jgi:hypothetical protein
MGPYRTLESWASRLGYIVERTDSGWVWHRENGPASREVSSEREVIDAILGEIRSEYEGAE